MLEEVLFYLRESPGMAPGLVIAGVAFLLWLAVRLTRSVRRRMGPWRVEVPLVRHVGPWVGKNLEWIALWFGVLCSAGAVILLADPVRLLVLGKSADGVVTTVVESTYRDHATRDAHIRSDATIRFEADGQVREIERSTSRQVGSTCIAGCYRKGDRLKILYLAEDPAGAKVHSFLGLFGAPLGAGFAAALAFLFWWLSRSERIEGGSRS